jgi:hypothetical protein
MAVQLVPNPLQADSSQPSTAPSELQKLREYCRRLNQALEVERAKSSKLRQYIARLNSTRVQPDPIPAAAPQNTDAALQTLVDDQTRLLEQLYFENQKQGSVLTDLENKIQQLLIANDKLKARNIELRRKLKPMQVSETPAARPIAVVKPISAPQRPQAAKAEETKTTASATESSGKQTRWFRFALTKKQS